MGKATTAAPREASIAPAASKLGLVACLALVMGNMIGSGVFLLPAALAPYGWNAVPGWAFTILGVLALVTVLGRLARAMPDADGPYGYVLASFGALPAFLIGYSYWISVWVGNAAVATAAVSYLSVFFPALGSVPGASSVGAVGLVWATTLVNLRGARAVGGAQIIGTLIKLVPLLLIVAIGMGVTVRSHGAALAPFPAGGFTLGAVSASAALSLWALTGFESASLATANVENAAVTVPRATMLGVAATGALYLIVCSGIALLLPSALAAASPAPFADFVARFWGRGPSLFVALFAAISAIGALNGMTLVQGAVPLSLARAGAFPRWFGETNAAGTPVRALVGSSVLTTILLVMNSVGSMADAFAFLALLATAVTLFLYLGVAVAALRLRIGGIVGIVAALFSLWTLWGAGRAATGWGLVLLASGIPVYALIRRAARRSAALSA